jgi:hypothetical protein
MAATQTSSSAMVRGHVRRLAPSSSSCLAHPPGFGERSPSTKGGARRGRGVVTRAAAANDAAASGGGFGGGFGSTSLGTLGSAIELRSRLQDLDVERNRSRGGRDGDGWEEINGAWCRTPPGRAWGVAHFIGGAVLGSYPHIAYGERHAVYTLHLHSTPSTLHPTPYTLHPTTLPPYTRTPLTLNSYPSTLNPEP